MAFSELVTCDACVFFCAQSSVLEEKGEECAELSHMPWSPTQFIYAHAHASQ